MYIYCHCNRIYTIIYFVNYKAIIKPRMKHAKNFIFKGGATIFPGSKIVMYTESCKYLLITTFLTCLGAKLSPHWRDVSAIPLEHPCHLSLTRERIHCRVSHGNNHKHKLNDQEQADLLYNIMHLNYIVARSSNSRKISLEK